MVKAPMSMLIRTLGPVVSSSANGGRIRHEVFHLQHKEYIKFSHL